MMGNKLSAWLLCNLFALKNEWKSILCNIKSLNRLDVFKFIQQQTHIVMWVILLTAISLKRDLFSS